MQGIEAKLNYVDIISSWALFKWYITKIREAHGAPQLSDCSLISVLLNLLVTNLSSKAKCLLLFKILKEKNPLNSHTERTSVLN